MKNMNYNVSVLTTKIKYPICSALSTLTGSKMESTFLVNKNKIDKGHDNDCHDNRGPNRIAGGAIIRLIDRFR